ncbi:MAG: lipopolysaccharide heptosyltransferase II [Acidiferrobacter sp.]
MGPAWVGDMVLAQSLFKLLKAQTPDATLDVIAPPWTAPLLARMPEVTTALPLAIAHGRLALRQRLRFGRRLPRRYDQAIVLPNSFKAALPAWASGARRRTGYLGELRVGLLNDIRREPRDAQLRTVDRFLMLARAPGAPLVTPPPPQLLADPARGLAILAAAGRAPVAGPVLALCPGAEYGPAKRWPVRHFAALAATYRERGVRVWLLGSTRDRAVAAAITAITADIEDFTGTTDLLGAVDLLALATAVVSNDSGLMHIAAALGKPLAALFGSSDPRHTPPLDPHAVIVWRHPPCSPCFARSCPLGHFRCLEDLRPDDVEAALSQALAGNAGPDGPLAGKGPSADPQ